MAEGPDPNRHFETDRELTGADGGLGNPPSTRMGLSSWVSALAALAVLAILLALML